MPLLDHFRPPLAPRRHWDSFHAAWAGAIADLLNEQLLPPDYFAEEMTSSGARVEIDVATFQDSSTSAGRNGPAVETQVWAPPAPAMTMTAVFPPHFAVRVYSSEGGAQLVAAVELVSPANKDRPETRKALVAKCANYLYQGISLVMVDIVTTRQANLHDELIRFMQAGEQFLLPGNPGMYAVAYRPIIRTDERIDVWGETLAVGQPLPVLPLALNAQICLPLDLEATYTDSCKRRRLP